MEESLLENHTVADANLRIHEELMNKEDSLVKGCVDGEGQSQIVNEAKETENSGNHSESETSKGVKKSSEKKELKELVDNDEI